MRYWPHISLLTLSILLITSCQSKERQDAPIVDGEDNKIALDPESASQFSPHSSHHSGADADDDAQDDDAAGCCHNGCDFASSGFGNVGQDQWYVIVTEGFPTTTDLSLNRNLGFSEGGIEITPTGVTVNAPGDYWVTFSAVLLNTTADTPLLPLFLIRNDVFDPINTTSELGAVGSLPPNLITTFQASGIMADITRGTTLSIVATNGGSPAPVPITVIAWAISLHKICQ